ncbi:hypothetical protein [Bacillus benzoevorans]|uniref:Uncharacterized protein n=1 Tax=Bacillus benzoevorans TaxID=1456 RepID=A0A7X0HP56_9BACI|nr:hypothetical protein [Bacillus benzoevorans]MBB6444397.1 hypothetical protein [Bacillus benzoevorans]
MRMVVISIVFLLSLPASFALADEGHSNSVSEDVEMFMSEEQGEGVSHGGHTMTPEEHSQMTDMTDGSAHNQSEHDSSGDDVSGHNDANAEGSHGHGGEVIEETPPNYTVLSVFGVINLSFLAAGLWNKRLRKKVKLDVDAGKKN